MTLLCFDRRRDGRTECVWDENPDGTAGGYDANNDPQTGAGTRSGDDYDPNGGCEQAGGTWVPHSAFSQIGEPADGWDPGGEAVNAVYDPDTGTYVLIGNSDAPQSNLLGCKSSDSFLHKLAEGADGVSSVTGLGALGAAGAAVVTSETGVGLLTFGGAAVVLEGVSKVASVVAIGANSLDHNYGAAAGSALGFVSGVGLGGYAERVGARAVAAGRLSENGARAINVGASADAAVNEQLLSTCP